MICFQHVRIYHVQPEYANHGRKHTGTAKSFKYAMLYDRQIYMQDATAGVVAFCPTLLCKIQVFRKFNTDDCKAIAQTWLDVCTTQIAYDIHSLQTCPDSKVHWANMGPIWGRQDPGSPHVGPMNLAIWVENCKMVWKALVYLILRVQDLLVPHRTKLSCNPKGCQQKINISLFSTGIGRSLSHSIRYKMATILQFFLEWNICMFFQMPLSFPRVQLTINSQWFR